MALNKRTTTYMAFNRLVEFLGNHRAVEGQCTHTSSVHPKGSFTIPPDERDTFFEIYNEVIQNGGDLYLTEMCEPDGSPFKVDIDLKFKPSSFIDTGLIEIVNEPRPNGPLPVMEEESIDTNYIINEGHTYEISHIKRLLYYIKQMLEEVLDLTKLEQPFYAVVMEKEKPSKKQNGLIGDGFHILFPYLVGNYALQHFVRNRIIQNTTFGKIFGDLAYQNEPEDIYDKGIIGRNWTVYGSKGKRGGALYTISHIYELTKEKASANNMIIKDLAINDLTDAEKSCLPRFLSVRGKPINVTFVSEEVRKLVDEWHQTKNEYRKRTKKIQVVQEIDEELEFIRRLIKLVSSRRSKSYDDWIRMGWCLHNIDEKNLLDDYIEFSKLCPSKYKPGECEKVWDSARDEGLGIGTLHYWARTDSPEEYTKIMAEDITRTIEAMPETHVGIANVMKKMYEHEFVCVQPQMPLNKREWYHFEDHRWIPNAICDIREKIYEDVVYCFRKAQYKFNRLRQLEGDKANDRRDLFKIKNDRTDKIKNKLETTTFIDGVIKECGYKLRKRDFLEMANNKPNLVGFNNGIYDLNSMTFREGLPEDYITMSTGIDYDFNSPEVKEVKKFIKQILPNKAVRDYAMYYMATCLHGDNEQQKLVVFTGEGGNGKSLLISLLEESLGDYTCALDVAYVTQKRQRASQASPGVMELRNRRLAIIHEPDEGDTLNMGIIKALTGNDKIKARNLFENDITFRNRAKLIMLCNALPTPSSQDDGVWRRIRIVHFPVQFVDDPKEPHERKKDPTLENKIYTWKQAFINLLLAYYQKYKTELKSVIPEPKEVREFTDQYRERTNVFLEFTKESLTPQKTDEPLSTNAIFQKFRSWFSNAYPGNKCTPKKEIQDYLKKTYKKLYTIKYGLKDHIFTDDIEVERVGEDEGESPRPEDDLPIDEAAPRKRRKPKKNRKEIDILEI